MSDDLQDISELPISVQAKPGEWVVRLHIRPKRWITERLDRLPDFAHEPAHRGDPARLGTHAKHLTRHLHG